MTRGDPGDHQTVPSDTLSEEENLTPVTKTVILVHMGPHVFQHHPTDHPTQGTNVSVLPAILALIANRTLTSVRSLQEFVTMEQPVSTLQAVFRVSALTDGRELTARQTSTIVHRPNV